MTEEEREIFNATQQDIVPQELLDTLGNLQRTDYKLNDSQRHATLSESFPAIVYTFGPDNWLYIKAIYMSFCVHDCVSPALLVFIFCLVACSNENGAIFASSCSSAWTSAYREGFVPDFPTVCSRHNRNSTGVAEKFVRIHQRSPIRVKTLVGWRIERLQHLRCKQQLAAKTRIY